MFRRKILHTGVVVGLIAAAVLGSGTVASASPTDFAAKAVHAGGAGATAAQLTGKLTWYNRSVEVRSMVFYVADGECGNFSLVGSQGFVVIDKYDGFGTACSYTEPVGPKMLDGSSVSGGINTVTITVHDTKHNIYGYAECKRSASVCTTGRY